MKRNANDSPTVDTPRQAFRYWPIMAMMAIVGCAPQRVSDLVVVNAMIWTGDNSLPAATTFAVRDGKFAYVGGDERQSRGCVSADAKILDAQGARILPGLIDAHLHLVSGGLQLSRLNLRDVPDRAAFIAAVAQRAKLTPKGEWILGGRWSTESWADSAQPEKEWIDAVTSDHPVLLSRMDGHGALANSVALKIFGIDKNGPPDPPGGRIERHPATHEPTGILKDAELDIVENLLPKPSPREYRNALMAAMKEANRHGLTCVDTMSEWRELASMEKLHNLGLLSLRVRMYVMEHDWPAFLDRVKAFKGDDMLRICGFKEYADGSLGSRTAYMAAPYSDNPPGKKDWHGLLRAVLQPAEPHTRLLELCSMATEQRLSCAVHSIGDLANHLVLDTYEAVESTNSGSTPSNPHSAFRLPQSPQTPSLKPQAPFRIEHAQHLLPTDIPRFAKLGVVASMQPLHKADDARYAEKAIGPERCKTSYAFRSLLDAGAHVAFGSDWPVVSLNPFLGIHAAVTGESLYASSLPPPKRGPETSHVFVPEQNITVEQALRCYTSGAAYASGDADRLGKIKEGYLADFIILDRDPYSVPLSEIKNVQVLQTFVGGRCVQPGGDRSSAPASQVQQPKKRPNPK